jgi:hypothetical protein
MRFVKIIKFALLLLLLIGNACLASSSPVDIKLDVKEFRLENGMVFLVVERPATPQVACRLAIRAGSALEQSGKTGIAHMLEHMMFKGTKNFGTLDVAKDQKLQKQIEEDPRWPYGWRFVRGRPLRNRAKPVLPICWNI